MNNFDLVNSVSWQLGTAAEWPFSNRNGPGADGFASSMRVVVVETNIDTNAGEMSAAELVRILDEH